VAQGRLEIDAVSGAGAGRGQPVYDAQRVEGAGPDDLLPEIVGPFLRRLRIERPYAYRELDDRELLLATRVLVPGAAGGVPSLAGLLAFARLPQHLFPQLEITFVEYPTAEGADLGRERASSTTRRSTDPSRCWCGKRSTS
jgi:ATP-dependent DNA helicase RecG